VPEPILSGRRQLPPDGGHERGGIGGLCFGVTAPERVFLVRHERGVAVTGISLVRPAIATPTAFPPDPLLNRNGLSRVRQTAWENAAKNLNPHFEAK
jgi:hypothetical protein